MFEVAPNDSEAYRQHKLARQITASAVGAGFSLVRAAGDYRLNTAFFAANPGDTQFQGWARTFYKEPKQDPEILHRSGLKLRSVASWGASVPLTARLIANLYYGLHSEWGGEENLFQQTAIGLDTVAVSTQTASVLAFCAGQQMALHHRWQSRLTPILRRSWQTGIAGNGFQMGAGMLRVGLEMHHYLETGELNNSTIFYGVADTFGGAAGIGWSHAVLKEAQRARTVQAAAAADASTRTATGAINGISREQHALLSVVEPASRVKIGLRVAGSVGSAIGLGFNIYSLTEALTDHALNETARRNKIISNSIGIAGSVLMIGAALMVGTVAAPLAGVALAAGTVALIGQTAFEYFA